MVVARTLLLSKLAMKAGKLRPPWRNNATALTQPPIHHPRAEKSLACRRLPKMVKAVVILTNGGGIRHIFGQPTLSSAVLAQPLCPLLC